MIPITLVTGFLGSGKTSFLKNFAKKNLNRKIIYLVNEFSPRDIDAEFLSSENKNIVSIPGGSIFCKCLITEFINQLKFISEKYAQAEGLIIEASGMANPKTISKMLIESKLDNVYFISHIISIVDPNSFFKLKHTLPNIIAQIESSDLIIINKIDICEIRKITETENEIKKINPKTKIFKAIRGNIDIELFDQTLTIAPNSEYASCKDPNYATFSTDYLFAENDLQTIISKFSDSIYRIKGWLNNNYFDYSSSGLQISPSEQEHQNILVWIISGNDSEKIKSYLKKNFNTSFDNE